jgi:hypothetical protein
MALTACEKNFNAKEGSYLNFSVEYTKEFVSILTGFFLKQKYKFWPNGHAISNSMQFIC